MQTNQNACFVCAFCDWRVFFFFFFFLRVIFFVLFRSCDYADTDFLRYPCFCLQTYCSLFRQYKNHSTTLVIQFLLSIFYVCVCEVRKHDFRLRNCCFLVALAFIFAKFCTIFLLSLSNSGTPVSSDLTSKLDYLIGFFGTPRVIIIHLFNFFFFFFFFFFCRCC